MHRTSHRTVAVRNAPRAELRVVNLGNRGRGVVAGRKIAAGQLIERSPVLIVPQSDRGAVDPTNVGNYIFMWEHGKTGEDLYSQQGRAAIVLGYTSLLNHSTTPNCDTIRYIDCLTIDLVARRTIARHEELTIDYGMTLWFTPE